MKMFNHSGFPFLISTFYLFLRNKSMNRPPGSQSKKQVIFPFQIGRKPPESTSDPPGIHFISCDFTGIVPPFVPQVQITQSPINHLPSTPLIRFSWFQKEVHIIHPLLIRSAHNLIR
jgi:hypothetical protein